MAIEGPSQQDFRACYNKNKKAYITLHGVKAIAITKDQAVAFPENGVPKSYVKYDPFLNLYLLRSSVPLEPIRQRSEMSIMKREWLGAVSLSTTSIGKFERFSNGSTPYDIQTTATPKGSIITCTCCEMYGIGAERGRFIGNRYLKHFAAYDTAYYGDVGARFESKGDKIFVKSIDPFAPNYGFRVGDEITRLNGKPIYSFREFTENILFAKEGTPMYFGVKGKKNRVETKIFARNVRSPHLETFLEHKGMHFNKQLLLTLVRQNSLASQSGLKKGDRLLQINKQPVKSIAGVQKMMSRSGKDPFYLLFDRQGFQFFVKIAR